MMILLSVTNTLAQTKQLIRKKVLCQVTKGTIPFLLDKVSSYSGIVIEYSTHYLNTDTVLTIDGGMAALGTVLNQVLAGQKVSIEERNNKIILAPSNKVLSKTEAYTLYGFTMEEGSREPLPYAVIKDLESGQISQSNMFGYYSLNLQEGKHYIQVKRSGHPPKTIEIFIRETTRQNLVISPVFLPEVKIGAGNPLQKDGGSRMDKYLSGAYNNFLGESDPVRSLNLLPGNIETQETTGKLVARGGDPDQSLFLLDGNPVFNPSHLLGEISIINTGSVKSIRQFKNDFPSRFDGAISSVTEVNTKDGSMDKWSAEASAGLLAGALAVDGPLQKGRTALMASVRHSWSNPLLNILDDNYRLRFYDIHFKLTHILDSTNKLMLTGYMGKDRLNLRQYDYQNLQVWGNRLASLNWNHLLGSRSFVNTTLNVSNYKNLAGMKFTLFNDTTWQPEKSKAFNNFASTERYEAKSQFELNASAMLQHHFGGKISYTVLQPFNTNISPEFMEEIDYYRPMKALRFRELSLYYESEFRIRPYLLIRPGLNFSTYKFRDYHHNGIQPRLFASFQINKHQQFIFSYSRMVQYLHQVISPFMGINSEFWVPSTRLLQPVESDMLNIGYNLQNKKGAFFSAEIYYKKMKNITNFAERGNIFFDENSWEKDILSGKGWSYGMELLSRKQMEKWRFQLSYALSWSWRQFEGINGGKKYPFRYDRRHNLNAVVNYLPSRNWDFGLVWYFSSGDMLFLPPGLTPDFDSPSPVNPGNTDPDEENPFIYDKSSYVFRRSPSYHRLNLNVNYSFSSGNRLKHKISTGLYNAYQAENKYLPDVWNMENDAYNTTLSGNRIFRLTLYLSYNLRF